MVILVISKVFMCFYKIKKLMCFYKIKKLMCFYKIIYGNPKISNFGYLVSVITENAHPYPPPPNLNNKTNFKKRIIFINYVECFLKEMYS